jgi:hypothetical protein
LHGLILCSLCLPSCSSWVDFYHKGHRVLFTKGAKIAQIQSKSAYAFAPAKTNP